MPAKYLGELVARKLAKPVLRCLSIDRRVSATIGTRTGTRNITKKKNNMETKVSKFYEVGARFTNYEGKKENATVCVEADTFGEAEAIVCAEFSASNADVSVRTMRTAPYDTVLFGESDAQWHIVRYKLMTIDAVTGREKGMPRLLLVQAAGLREALAAAENYLKDNVMASHDNVAANVTHIEDVILRKTADE